VVEDKTYTARYIRLVAFTFAFIMVEVLMRRRTLCVLAFASAVIIAPKISSITFNRCAKTFAF
jgi:hypothetical protein